MKKVIITSILGILTLLAGANDRLYIPDFNMVANETKQLSVMRDNDTVYSAFQFDLSLPSNLSPEYDDGDVVINLTSRKGDHSISTNKLPNGIIRVFVTSMTSSTFSGSNGAIATFNITANGKFNGKYFITINNVICVEENGRKHLLEDSICTINPNQSIHGDVNGDGVMTAADITALYDYMLNNDSSHIVNGDQTGDGIITAADITAVYNIILEI